MSQAKKIIGLMVALGLSLTATLAFSQSQSVKEQIAERIAPVGTSCMAGDDCAAAPVATASSDGPRSGQQVYDSACHTCHKAGVSGAPIMGNADQWGPRIDKGMETLYTHAIKGFNAMPAMGLCASCSEKEIQAAVDYMVENSQ